MINADGDDDHQLPAMAIQRQRHTLMSRWALNRYSGCCGEATW